MKIIFSPRIALVVAAAIFLHHNATAIPTVNLRTASSFAILAGSEITDVQDASGGTSTIVRGDVGLSPTTGASIGLTAGQLLNGTIYAVDASGPGGSVFDKNKVDQAKADLTDAYNKAFLRIPTTTFLGADNQLGLAGTLISGVYRFGGATTANLIGTLTLDAQGDPNAVWIFQATSTLVTGSSTGSKVVFKDGVGSPCNVFWQVGSSATLGTGTAFVGNIMAYASVGLDNGATLNGSALAETAAVTLDHNKITQEDCSANGGTNGTGVPDTGSTLLLLGSGLAALLAFRQRFFSPA